MIPVLAALAFVAQPIEAPAEPSPMGLWINRAASVIIEIEPCDPEMCGTVKWASAKARRDAAKGAGELIGASLLTKLRARGEGKWAGKLFIPDRNIRVTAKLTLTADGRLKVSGCAIGKSLCKSEYWNRTALPLPTVD